MVSITAKGAAGGPGNPLNLPASGGGSGAALSGTFSVTGGDVLTVFVGEKGKFRSNDSRRGSGGGGGSAVVLNSSTLLVAAAGGGGGGRGGPGTGGLANTSSTAAGGAASNGGAGGGGFGFAGANAPFNTTGGGAASLTDLSSGGLGNQIAAGSSPAGGNGGRGFGGGGGAFSQSGGGGGGYRGGDGSLNNTDFPQGRGGDSFFNVGPGTLISAVAGTQADGELQANAGNGRVTIVDNAADNTFTTICIGTPPNTAPTASFQSQGGIALHCTSLDGATANVRINVADVNNDPLTVKWSVNNVVVATRTLPAGATSDTLVNQLFGFAPSTLSVSVTDGKSTPVVISTTVTVADHDQPAPDVAQLPDITGECSATITTAPTATDDCDNGTPPGTIIGTTTDPLTYTDQGTYVVTWTYTDPHAPFKTTTQQQTVIVKDVTPPTISCPADVSVAYGSVPAAATTVAGFLAQGGTISDNCDPNGTVTSYDSVEGYCPTVITRSYTVTDAAGNASYCAQFITVNNLFAADGIVWHQPLARNGASEDTDPGAGNTLKYRFKLGSTIPIKVHAQGCSGAVTGNANVTGTVVVFGDTDCDGTLDAGELPIDYNGVGEAGGVMDKIDGHLKYNLDTKKLVQTFKCYILQVTITDSSTGESVVEIVPLQSK